MSASLHPTEVHRRRHRKAKRDKLRAKLATAPAAARAAIEAKLEKTYPLGSEPRPPRSAAHGTASVPVAPDSSPR